MEFKILIKKINNTLTKEEEKEFDAWFSESIEHQNYFNKVKKNTLFSGVVDKEQSWTKIKKSITYSKRKKLFAVYKVAASIAILLSISYITFLQFNVEKPPVTSTHIDVQHPVLTLENGEEIVLGNQENTISPKVKSDGKQLLYKKEIVDEKKINDEKITYNYLTTKRGKTFLLSLADGTNIHLNAGSKLKYPTKFYDGKLRQVELLYGEAYFDVSPSEKNGGSRFKVVSGLQNIEVVGTKFNVKNYTNDKNIVTTLSEGKVYVNYGKEQVTLVPNQQIILDKQTQKHQLIYLNNTSYLSWIDGVFYFKETTLNEIAKVLVRWYDVDFTFETDTIRDIKFNGVLNKKQSIDFIIKSISKTSNLTFEKTAKNIHFMKKKGV